MLPALSKQGLTQIPTPTVATVGETIGTSAAGGARPRLVGQSTIDEIETIIPGSGIAVRHKGLRGVVPYITANPKKSAAVATVVALGSIEGYQQLAEIASSHPVDRVREWASELISGVDNILAAAGLDDPFPNEDGSIAGNAVGDMQQSYALVKNAKAKFKNACAAAGGRTRLLAIMDFMAIDDDLKRIVVEDDE